MNFGVYTKEQSNKITKKNTKSQGCMRQWRCCFSCKPQRRSPLTVFQAVSLPSSLTSLASFVADDQVSPLLLPEWVNEDEGA
jgi:hypothetical protein